MTEHRDVMSEQPGIQKRRLPLAVQLVLAALVIATVFLAGLIPAVIVAALLVLGVGLYTRDRRLLIAAGVLAIVAVVALLFLSPVTAVGPDNSSNFPAGPGEP